MKKFWILCSFILVLLIGGLLFFDKSIFENKVENKLEDVEFADKNWGYRFLKIDEVHHSYKVTGEGVKIAIIDTGVADDKRIKNVVEGKNFVQSGTSYTDSHGHGTHIYGILSGEDIGVAPGADIYVAKALSMDLKGEMKDVISAIDWSIEKDVDVILMPFGFLKENKEFEEAVNRALDKNIFVVSSVGNYGLKENIDIMYPAKYSKVIAVGALEKDGGIWKGTTIGKELDYLLPGQEILSYSLDGNFLIASGTSMASAYMAGVLALFIEYNNNIPKKELYYKLLKIKEELGNIGNVSILEIDKILK
ncbi:S8 family serine peptidase [Solibacillus sp. FSL W7-1324]|uniref:S8 family serine peptidase n=1 Tax=Solibacillus sp. FSL W7-1324 TaxID=2921701 RepID=UPI0030F4E4D6